MTSLHRIGILEMAAPDQERLDHWRSFTDGLREHGLVTGRDIALDYRWANGVQERLAAAAADLVKARVDVIVTAGTPAAKAAMMATSEIPIVMATGVSLGTQLTAAATTAPNVTGISDLPHGVSEQRLMLLQTLVGGTGPLAFLADSANPSSPLALRETRSAAQAAELPLRDYWIKDADELDGVLATMQRDGIRGFVVAPGAMFFAARNELARCARTYRLPAMTVRREYAEAGCLMAYGAPLRQNYRQAAELVSRVLAGTKPSALPIVEPREFDFVINLDTAQALAITVPATLSTKAELIGAPEVR